MPDSPLMVAVVLIEDDFYKPFKPMDNPLKFLSLCFKCVYYEHNLNLPDNVIIFRARNLLSLASSDRELESCMSFGLMRTFDTNTGSRYAIIDSFRLMSTF